jgi:hypothetical protein
MHAAPAAPEAQDRHPAGPPEWHVAHAGSHRGQLRMAPTSKYVPLGHTQQLPSKKCPRLGHVTHESCHMTAAGQVHGG